MEVYVKMFFNTRKLPDIIENGVFDGAFCELYQGSASKIYDRRRRYIAAAKEFNAHFGNREAVIVSAPARAEILGNHTDHQNGRVLAAAADLDIIGVASANGQDVIRLKSQGYEPCEISLTNLTPKPNENDSSAIVRGITAWLNNRGYETPGFDVYMQSDVPPGAGLSSSAAFEVAIGNCFSALEGLRIGPIDIAKAGQYAENIYMKKPSGLMDQIACSAGGLVFIDFYDRDNPVVVTQALDLKDFALNLCVTDTRRSHADLTDEYAAIVREMKDAARVFGKEYLGAVGPDEFFAGLKRVRGAVGDRAALRAAHFFEENERVTKAAEYTKNGDIGKFLETVHKSGQSSVANLQNIFKANDPRHQDISVALMLSEYILKGRGATRVHGGGFAGTVLAFVPDETLAEYKTGMEEVFGEGAVCVINIRNAGGYVFGQ